MRIVLMLQDDKGNVLKEVEAKGSSAEMNRIGAWWREYFGNPMMSVPDTESKEEGARKEVPADIPEMFTRWAGQMLGRLSTAVKEHEGRQQTPAPGKLLG